MPTGRRRPALPLLMHVEGRRVVVVGGGGVAARKVATLLRSGADVTVVAPDLHAELRRLATEGAIRVEERLFRGGDDVDGAFLVFAATNDRAVNATVVEQARAAGALSSSADDPSSSDFYSPSVARSGEIEVFISTGGASPALAAAIRGRIERAVGPEFDAIAAVLRHLRPLIKECVAEPQRRTLLEQLASEELVELLRNGRDPEFVRRVETALREYGVSEDIGRVLRDCGR